MHGPCFPRPITHAYEPDRKIRLDRMATAHYCVVEQRSNRYALARNNVVARGHNFLTGVPMLILILTVLALGVVLSSGAVTLIASIPLSVLERAEQHGRFAGLGSCVSIGESRMATPRRASTAQRGTLHSV